MAKMFNGRYTAAADQPFVVFLIGMRINQWWRFEKWLSGFGGGARRWKRSTPVLLGGGTPLRMSRLFQVTICHGAQTPGSFPDGEKPMAARQVLSRAESCLIG